MKISIVLEALTGSFETDTKRASKSFEKDVKRIEDNAVKAGKVVGAALAAGAVAIAAIVQNQANAIAEFQDLAEKIGDTAENIASLKLAADVSGTAFDTIAAASVKLTAGLAKTEDETKGAGLALRALGIDFDSFLKLSPVEQLDAVARALAGFEDGAGKTATAVQLFGKSGADLIPFLNDLADGSERQITLTQDQIDEADAYTKQVARLKSELGLLVTQASAEVIPVFGDVLGILKELATKTGNLKSVGDQLRSDGALREFAEDSVVALAILGESLFAIGKTIRAVIGSFQTVWADIQVAGAFVAGGGFVGLATGNEALDKALKDRERIAREANDRYVNLIEYNGTAVSDALRAAFKKESLARNGGGIDFLAGVGKPSNGPLIFRNDEVETIAPMLPGFKPGKPVLNVRPPANDPRPPKPAREAKEAISEAQRLIASMQEQLALSVALGEADKVRISLANGYYGVTTDTQKSALMGLAEQLDANETRKKQEAELNNLARDAAAIFESTRDPVEKLAAEFERLNMLRSTLGVEGMPLLDADTYARAVTAAQDAFDQIGTSGAFTITELSGLGAAMADLREEAERTTKNLLSDSVNAGVNATSGLLSDLTSGSVSAGDALKNFARNFASSMAKIATNALATLAVLQLLDAIYPGLGRTTAALSGAAGPAIAGARANGGPVNAGLPYLVGERGPELVIPRTASTVISNEQMRKSTGQGSAPQNIRIVNAFDTAVIGDYLGSSDGERAILNVMQRNGSRIRNIAGGG